jgi:hypothetical protein
MKTAEAKAAAGLETQHVSSLRYNFFTFLFTSLMIVFFTDTMILDASNHYENGRAKSSR